MCFKNRTLRDVLRTSFNFVSDIAKFCFLLLFLVPSITEGNPHSLDKLIIDGNDTSPNCEPHYCPTNKTLNGTKCRCDTDCWKRRNCCLNVWNSDDDDESFGLNSKNIEKLIRNDRFVCIQVVNTFYVMISSCPSSKVQNGDEIEHLRGLCESGSDSLSTVPVTSLSTNLTYKNIYCAVCNDDIVEISFWKTELRCKNQIENVSEALEAYFNGNRSKFCNLQINPQKVSDGKPLPTEQCVGTPRPNPVDPPMTSKCLPSFNATERHEWFCRMFYAPVKLRNAVFRNVYCALCNVIDFNDTETTCWTPTRAYMKGFKITESGLKKSFTLLLDADFHSGGLVVGTVERCPSGHIYDPFRGECRLVVCGKQTKYTEGRCLKREIIEIQSSDPQILPSKPRSNEKNVDSDCVGIRYESKEVNIDSNGTLTIIGREKRFQEGRYESYDNGSSYRVCVDSNLNYLDKFPEEAFEYLTVIGSIISIVSLFLKMTIFVLLPETRNFPDRIVFCLSASLFVAHFLFATAVTSTSNYPICAAVAIALHYSFLASFAWMTTLAYDIYSTFATVEGIAPYVSAKRKFVRYSFYSWTLPLLIVTTAVLFDWTCIVDTVSPFRPLYGRALCWISSRIALLVFFVTPVAIHVVVNTVLFYCTAHSIWFSSRQTLVAQQQNSRCSKGSTSRKPKSKAHHLRLSLYIKLALIMGLTWISGLVAIYGRCMFLWYVFVVLNTLQGLFIFIAFTPYRKVRKAWIRMRTPERYYDRPSRCESYYNGHLPLHRSSTKSSQLTRTSSSNASQRTFSIGQ